MNLLLIGGTRLVGSHLVQAALARGHRVTLFNRGRHRAEPPPGVRWIEGDRHHHLHRLAQAAAADGQRWDAVVDTCGYVPGPVAASAAALAPQVGCYVYVSSVSAYADCSAPGVNEDAPLATLDDDRLRQVEAIDPASADYTAAVTADYGALKARCEAAVQAALPGRALVLRPGLIVGPRDDTDRFAYWVQRIARPARADAEVLCPAPPAQPIQYIDAADLAEFTLDALARGTTGCFNLVVPAGRHTLADLAQACRSAADSPARCCWVDEAWLLQQQVAPWTDLPLWIPESLADSRGFLAIDSARAVAAGLRCRPLPQTVRAVLDWLAHDRGEQPLRAGLAPAREAQLLAAWHARAAGG